MSCKIKTVDIPFRMCETVLESRNTPISNPELSHAAPENGKTTGDAALVPAKKKRRLRKGMRIGDALRREGLDEREVARKLADLFTRHSPDERQPSHGGGDKVLFDALKECLRHLDDTSGADETLSVKLIHRVPRPSRPRSNDKTEKK